jgi:hypothetical protein
MNQTDQIDETDLTDRPDRQEYHGGGRESSLHGCHRKLTLPTLTGTGPFIMVSGRMLDTGGAYLVEDKSV